MAQSLGMETIRKSITQYLWTVNEDIGLSKPPRIVHHSVQHTEVYTIVSILITVVGLYTAQHIPPMGCVYALLLQKKKCLCLSANQGSPNLMARRSSSL